MAATHPAAKRTSADVDSLTMAAYIVRRCRKVDAIKKAAKSPEELVKDANERAAHAAEVRAWIDEHADALEGLAMQRLDAVPNGWHITRDDRFVVATMILKYGGWFASTGVEPSAMLLTIQQLLADRMAHLGIMFSVNVTERGDDFPDIYISMFAPTAR